MAKYRIPRLFRMTDLPEYRRLLAVNPGTQFEAHQVAAMYTRAIEWLAILGTIWPDFEKTDYLSIEVAYILGRDAEKENYPEGLYRQIAETIAMFWKIQLDDLYPTGGWTVEVWDDPEVTVVAEKHKKAK